MSTALAPIQEEPTVSPNDYHLIAVDRPQLEAAHAKMIGWAHVQIATVQAEKKAEEELLAVAKERKWATAPFKRRIAIMDRRIVFYQKIEEALRAGYVIVPNFQMEIFAIRTKAQTPRGRVQQGRHNRFFQSAQLLQAGEGEYRDPNPLVHTEVDRVDDGKGGKKENISQWPDHFDPEIHFPIALAKPALMQRTATAMASKLFDEIGVAVNSSWSGRMTGDPIILGRIRNPRQRADMTFFIGWYFDPTDL